MSTQLVCRRSYDSDLSDNQWKLIEPFIPTILSNYTKGGRPAKYQRREILNAILYVVRTGCQWRLLPHDFPAWKTVYDYFIQWHQADIFVSLNDQLRTTIRVTSGRNGEPTAGIIRPLSKVPQTL